MVDQVVTQEMLREFLVLKDAEEKLALKKKMIKELLSNGATVEKGEHSAKLRDVKGRKYPPWKTVVIQRLGAAEAKKIEDETVRNPSSQSLIVI